MARLDVVIFGNRSPQLSRFFCENAGWPMTHSHQDQDIKITTRRGHVIEVSSEEELQKVARVLGIAAPSPSTPRPPTLDKLSPERSLVLLGKELLRRDKPINTAQVADLVGLR